MRILIITIFLSFEFFGFNEYMSQNTKQTASSKWNNHFEGLATANPHYQHIVDLLLL